MLPGAEETVPASAAAVERSLWDRITIGVLGVLLWILMRLLCGTLRLRLHGSDQVDALHREGKGALLVSWHGSTMVPVFWLRRYRPYGLISTSRDGEIEALAFRLLGWRTIRGSSMRGAAGAVLGAVRCLKRGNFLAMTPDGPRGPARDVKPGSLFLAKASGCPIVPVGVASDRYWRVNSWDTYMVPKPVAKVHVAFGEPMYFARDDDDRSGEAELARRINLAHTQAGEYLGSA